MANDATPMLFLSEADRSVRRSVVQLAGKTCLITGASGGIGEALGYRMAEQGAYVVLFARRAAALERVAAAIGADRAAVAVGDVTNPDDLRAAVETAVTRFGGLDVLVNNAGVAVMARLATVPVALWEQGFRVNVLGPILALQAALPAMRARGGGLIVNVSSAMSLRPTDSMAIYSATKAALNVISASMRIELERDNIRVLTVFPGLIANDFGKNTLSDDERLVAARRETSWTRTQRTSDDAARDIIAAIHDDASFFRSETRTPLEVPV
ncbi:MAG: SDR family oxidoreductase [Dehalococcoidia bacterium]|nr:SDR family oxidoreductase [Dehalococcoidia bacterium]